MPSIFTLFSLFSRTSFRHRHHVAAKSTPPIANMWPLVFSLAAGGFLGITLYSRRQPKTKPHRSIRRVEADIRLQPEPTPRPRNFKFPSRSNLGYSSIPAALSERVGTFPGFFGGCLASTVTAYPRSVENQRPGQEGLYSAAPQVSDLINLKDPLPASSTQRQADTRPAPTEDSQAASALLSPLAFSSPTCRLQLQTFPMPTPGSDSRSLSGSLLGLPDIGGTWTPSPLYRAPGVVEDQSASGVSTDIAGPPNHPNSLALRTTPTLPLDPRPPLPKSLGLIYEDDPALMSNSRPPNSSVNHLIALPRATVTCDLSIVGFTVIAKHFGQVMTVTIIVHDTRFYQAENLELWEDIMRSVGLSTHDKPFNIHVQLGGELDLDQGQCFELLKFIGDMLHIYPQYVGGFEFDARGLPNVSRDNQQCNALFALPNLASFKFNGNLRYNIPQPWRCIWNLSPQNFTTLCLDNLGEEGLHIDDCVHLLNLCEHLEEFSVGPLVSGQIPTLFGVPVEGKTVNPMKSLRSLSILSLHDIRVLLRYVSFPSARKVQLHLTHLESMEGFATLSGISWRLAQGSRLSGLTDESAIDMIKSLLPLGITVTT